MDEAQNVLRRRASQLMAKTYAIRCYKLWRCLEVVPKYTDITKARKNLIGLSRVVKLSLQPQMERRKHKKGKGNRKTLEYQDWYNRVMF